MIHLDHNSGFFIHHSYFSEEWGNPSSAYEFGSKLKGVVQQIGGRRRGRGSWNCRGAAARNHFHAACCPVYECRDPYGAHVPTRN